MDAMYYYFFGYPKTYEAPDAYCADCGAKPKKKCPFGTSLKCYTGFGLPPHWACVGPFKKISWG